MDKKEKGIGSIEGFIIFVRNFDIEIEEEDVYELFSEYGEVTKVVLNLDRETGYVKGYGLIQYRTREEAEKAISEGDKKEFRGKVLEVGWAFKAAPQKKRVRDVITTKEDVEEEDRDKKKVKSEN